MGLAIARQVSFHTQALDLGASELTDVIDAVPAGELLRLYVFRPRFDRSFFAILRLAD